MHGDRKSRVQFFLFFDLYLIFVVEIIAFSLCAPRLFDLERGFPAPEKLLEKVLERFVDMLKPVAEFLIDGLFEFGNDVLERRGGGFKIDQFFRQEFIALFRLVEFFNDRVAIPYAGFLDLDLQTLDGTAAFLLFTSLFRQSTLRDFRLIPTLNCSANESDPLTHFFIESLTRPG